MPKYCCLFNHFNSNKTINAYVFALLDYFSTLDCEQIIISNSPLENEEGKLLLKKRFKGKFIERENKGYDFGAWQYAMRNQLIPADTEYLFLLNDSVFGPLYSLDKIVPQLIADPEIDFWGLTESHEIQWHLQSYFLCFKRNVFTSKTFKKFFEQEFNELPKSEIIKRGELKLATLLANNGFKGKALIDVKKLTAKNSEAHTHRNPTLFFVSKLIEEHQFPFIKKEFLFSNPGNIDINGGVLAMLARETSYPVEYINEALEDRCFKPEAEKIPTPLIDVICHIYYLNTAYRFLIELSELKKYNCRFVFNLSAPLYADPYFIKNITAVFNNCIILQASNLGKDIGGKLAMIDICRNLDHKSTYTILLHDKQSPHSSMGETWRKKLFRIIRPDYIPVVEKMFKGNNKVGIVASSEFIKSEYDKRKDEFSCTSNHILKKIISEYQLSTRNFEFIGGTMFWIRSEILETFFANRNPLQIRSTLEKGNVLDNNQGSVTHAWERVLGWTASELGYEIKGLDE